MNQCFRKHIGHIDIYLTYQPRAVQEPHTARFLHGPNSAQSVVNLNSVTLTRYESNLHLLLTSIPLILHYTTF